ncbi:AraC family transcriptional regulator [Candidatus Dojkabacteria bacterium]|nr:AraC family transcriptional regulator [Candidatus Dojkabacteria bacterium]
MNSQSRFQKKYITQINKAIDYIQNNIDGELTLKAIAQSSRFSQYHFHRIFSAITGETLAAFIKRIRLEKSVTWLCYYPEKSITEIAFACGFSSSQVFARMFKEKFHKTPSKYRQDFFENNENSKNRNIIRKQWQEPKFTINYTSTQGRPNLIYKSIDMEVEVKTLPDMPVAYIRHIGAYQGNTELFGKLFDKISKWAGSHGLLNENTKMYSIYYDNPDVTDDTKLRVDICVSVPEGTKTDGEISSQTLKGGKYAIATFKIKDPAEYQEVWNKVYQEWIPDSGYVPDDKPCFEMYDSDCKEKEGEYTHIVKICIPVRAE